MVRRRPRLLRVHGNGDRERPRDDLHLRLVPHSGNLSAVRHVAVASSAQLMLRQARRERNDCQSVGSYAAEKGAGGRQDPHPEYVLTSSPIRLADIRSLYSMAQHGHCDRPEQRRLQEEARESAREYLCAAASADGTPELDSPPGPPSCSLSLSPLPFPSFPSIHFSSCSFIFFIMFLSCPRVCRLRVSRRKSW